MKNRIVGLDYLRAFCAIGIMIFHYNSILISRVEASQLLGKIEIFGVSIFYIISGIILFHIYEKKSINLKFISEFYIKRFLRVFPLFWLATFITLLIQKKLP